MITTIMVDSENHPDARGRLLFDDCPSHEVLKAYQALGFRGMVSWHADGMMLTTPIDQLLEGKVI